MEEGFLLKRATRLHLGTSDKSIEGKTSLSSESYFYELQLSMEKLFETPVFRPPVFSLLGTIPDCCLDSRRCTFGNATFANPSGSD